MLWQVVGLDKVFVRRHAVLGRLGRFVIGAGLVLRRGARAAWPVCARLLAPMTVGVRLRACIKPVSRAAAVHGQARSRLVVILDVGLRGRLGVRGGRGITSCGFGCWARIPQRLRESARFAAMAVLTAEVGVRMQLLDLHGFEWLVAFLQSD